MRCGRPRARTRADEVLATDHEIVRVVGDLRIEALGLAQRRPAQNATVHVDIAEQGKESARVATWYNR